ncbi:MAG: AraC family transcriptional regulator [Cyanobacteria bacterium P01_F01_bin.86]
MAIALHESDIADLMEQEQKITPLSSFCTQYSSPSVIGGEGSLLDLKLRGGLGITIRNNQLPQTLSVQRQHEESFPIVAKVYLSGDSRVRAKHVPEFLADYEENAGHSYLYCLPDMVEWEEWQANPQIQVVMVSADLDYFCSLSPNTQALPVSLQRLLQPTGRFHQPLGKTTLAMNRVAQQILHCPYQGTTQQIYLECKALELLALQLNCLEEKPVMPRPSALKPGDLERVEYARDLLVKCIDNPPSLIELAHRVGLSNRKLKQGFRELFGTTVFGYLYDYRMEQAQRWLRRPHITVVQVATKVGYRNPEAFSTAFRRKFAMSPKAYQLAQRG